MILLDTHALIWWTSDKEKLPKKLNQELSEAYESGNLAVSAISIWEIALLYKKDKMTLKMPFGEWYDYFSQLTEIKSVPVDNEIAVRSVNLPGEYHKDPADRIIIATALSLGCPLVTKDKKIHAYKFVKSVW
jgi:PIN domain nuclease of toxin-antitoxin system